jgi:hypothetical protein
MLQGKRNKELGKCRWWAIIYYLGGEINNIVDNFFNFYAYVMFTRVLICLHVSEYASACHNVLTRVTICVYLCHTMIILVSQ